jgi:putative alpha-1,2-mannosidase
MISIWDQFRAQLPFLTIVDTPSMVEMVKGLINIYNYQGWLPDCHMSLCKGYTQGGSNADNVLSDVFQKVNDTDIDWNTAYEAVVKDAEVEPYGERLQSKQSNGTALTQTQIGVAKAAAAWIAGRAWVTSRFKTLTTKGLVP